MYTRCHLEGIRSKKKKAVMNDLLDITGQATLDLAASTHGCTAWVGRGKGEGGKPSQELPQSSQNTSAKEMDRKLILEEHHGAPGTESGTVEFYKYCCTVKERSDIPKKLMPGFPARALKSISLVPWIPMLSKIMWENITKSASRYPGFVNRLPLECAILDSSESF